MWDSRRAGGRDGELTSGPPPISLGSSCRCWKRYRSCNSSLPRVPRLPARPDRPRPRRWQARLPRDPRRKPEVRRRLRHSRHHQCVLSRWFKAGEWLTRACSRIADEDAVGKLVRTFARTYKRIDGLVNCAGAGDSLSPWRRRLTLAEERRHQPGHSPGAPHLQRRLPINPRHQRSRNLHVLPALLERCHSAHRSGRGVQRELDWRRAGELRGQRRRAPGWRMEHRVSILTFYEKLRFCSWNACKTKRLADHYFASQQHWQCSERNGNREQRGLRQSAHAIIQCT